MSTKCQDYTSSISPDKVTQDDLNESLSKCGISNIIYGNWLFNVMNAGNKNLEFDVYQVDLMLSITDFDFDSIDSDTLRNIQTLKIKGGNTILHWAVNSYQVKNLKSLITEENINKQNDIGNSPLFHVCQDYYEIFMHISYMIKDYREKTFHDGFSTAIATITTKSKINAYRDEHYSTYGKIDTLLYFSQQKTLLEEAGYAVSHPNKNLLISSDIINKAKPMKNNNELLDKLFELSESFFNQQQKEQNTYKIEMSKVTAQKLKNDNKYYVSTDKDSTYFIVPITNEDCGKEKLQVLFEYGASPDMTNELGMTPQDIILIYCPNILSTYNNLFEKNTIIGDTTEHQEL